MNTAIYDDLTGTGKELQEVLSLFNNDQLNTVPFTGSWTAGQVAEHILKSASGVLDTLNGPEKAADRDPEAHIKQLRELFLNFDIKMQSPDFIIPSNEPKDKNLLANELKNTFEGIETAAKTKDLYAICTAFEMPVLGLLSRTEFIHFTIFHTQRHIHQLKNIRQTLNK